MSNNSQDVSKNEAINNRENIELKLSLNPNEEKLASDFRKQILQEELESLPPLKEGQINIDSIYAFEEGDKYEVGVYIRNGFPISINLENVPFTIVDENGKEIGRQVFDLKDLGDIPSRAARPWKLYFDKENITVDKIPTKGWQVNFDGDLKAVKSVNVTIDNIPERLPEEQKKEIEAFVDDLPTLEYGKFDVYAFKLSIEHGRFLCVTLLMRNGDPRGVTVRQLPVTVRDQDGNVVVSELLNLDEQNVRVEGFGGKIFNFVITDSKVLSTSCDLSKCTVKFNELVK